MQALVSGLILIAVFGAMAAGAGFVAARLLAATRAPAGSAPGSAAGSSAGSSAGAPISSPGTGERPDA